MIIESLQIENFRSILSETLHCENLTALVGANGAGKSSLLKALDLFYSPTPKIDGEDFYNGDNSKEISVTITFKELSEKAREQFASYLQDGKLSVERVFAMEEKKTIWKYHGSILKDPNLKGVREGLTIKDRGTTAKAEYEKVRSLQGYENLPAWPRKLDDAQEILKKWESEHPSLCTRERDEGQFFGFKEVAQGYLGRYTRFLYIPAVRDASDDSIEGRNTVFTSLMDLVVRSVLANKKELKELQEVTQEKFKEIMNSANLTELDGLAESMTKTLKTFVPEAKIDLLWQALSDVSLPFPQADIKLVEDGYSSAIHRTGHGLQRAFILTMLQHLVMAQAAAEAVPKEGEDQQIEREIREEPKLPDLVIAIEEPEIYQHPNRQRHLASILMKLAEGKTPGVAEKTQILYSTHAPLFVGIDRINQIRLLRKMPNEDKPKITKIISTNTDKVAEEIWKAEGEPGPKYTGETMLPRLQTIMTPWMSEGFFADVAVLVEGEDDRAAILGVAKSKGIDLESNGFAVIPCGGKTCLDRPATIFRQLGIPVYLIWDDDKGESDAKPGDNHRLLRLMEHPVEDWPNKIHDDFSCFEEKLEKTLCSEIGDEKFNSFLTECQTCYCIAKKKHAIKNPMVISDIILKAQKEGKNSPTLEAILERILKKKTSAAVA